MRFALSISLLLAAFYSFEAQAAAASGPTYESREKARLIDTLQPTRLVLIETQSFDDSRGTLRTFVREVGGKVWTEVASETPVVVGRNGLGWGFDGSYLASENEPVKKEGDGRTPAGLFRLGRPFLLNSAGNPAEEGYMDLTANRLFCVDDVRSDKYNHILPFDSVAPDTSGERMWEIGLYKRGIVVDYPTSPKAKSGSCIFIHVWKTPETPTVGCVAAAESTVEWLQGWVANATNGVWIAIIPREARGRIRRVKLPE